MKISKQDLKLILFLIAIFLAVELISLSGYFWPGINQAAFFILALFALVITIYRPEYGLILVLSELVIGSKGYLFYFPLESGQLISIRIVIWAIFMLVFFSEFIFQLIKQKKDSVYLKNILQFKFIKPYALLFVTILLGLISALIYQNDILNIFLDINGWLYFLLLFSLIALKLDFVKILKFLLAATIWVSLKTLILLFIFSYNFSLAVPVYAWLRKTLVGEMTLLGAWNRVFIQSQIFPIIAYFYFLFLAVDYNRFKDLFKREKLISLFLLALFFSTIVISLSRSFWVGILISGFLALLYLIFKSRPYNYKIIFKVFSVGIVSIILGMILIFISISPGASKQLERQLAQRVQSQDEAAVVSRWALLPKIMAEIKLNPITGQGFGATATYISADPRVLAKNPSGVYTTYAFEWGYLDIWLKTGLIGLAAYLWLLFLLIKEGIRLDNKKGGYLYLGLSVGLVFLVATHIFTPYLNHPLGIGFILLCSCLISQDRVY